LLISREVSVNKDMNNMDKDDRDKIFKNDAMESQIQKAENILKKYKGDKYTFGINCLDAVAKYILEFGDNTLLIISQSSWAATLRKKVLDILGKNKIKIKAEVGTSAPNTPLEDVIKLADIIRKINPASIVCVGGGSAIDCAKNANALVSVGENHENLEKFFGVGEVSKIAAQKNKKLYPLIAVQIAASSGAHLSKNAVLTINKLNQKKLVSDELLIPDRAVFDYSTTLTTPLELTLDGAMDGLAHSLEVYYGADINKIGIESFKKLEDVCLTSISMIVNTLPKLINDLKNIKYREIIGLATDLGGYALILGGTGGAHLNSFSLVDILTHGRACAVLNPYYTIFFAPAIKDKLIKIAEIYKDYIIKEDKSTGFGKIKFENIKARQLGELVAKAMIDFSMKIGFPVKLNDIRGFSDKHIDRILEAAKNPQLEMKLKNMPVPLNAQQVDYFMRPVLLAAKTGDFSYIKNII
jgi:alcohol dehydrogenase class IV